MRVADRFHLVGTIVDGRYRVDDVAGQGGHSVVYRAYHLTFESAIALKVLKLPSSLEPIERKLKLAEFRREGKVLFDLSRLHPSIVRAFESGVIASHDGAIAPYLALEWLDGKSLDREIKYRREKALPPLMLREIVALLDHVAEGLAVAHARGIAHRDIKPGNLFVSTQGARHTIKLLDFGIAKILDQSLTMTGRLTETSGMGMSFTPMYAAPEQWLPRLGATGPWTDVHAWALLCIELMTGRAPLQGSEPAHIMAACLDRSSRPTPRTLGYEVSDEIESVFARALDVDPSKRFPELRAFWDALVGAVPSVAKSPPDVMLLSLASPMTPDIVQAGDREPTGRGPVVKPSRPPPSRTSTSTTRDRRPTRRHKAQWSVAVAVLLFAVLGATFSRTSEGGADDQDATPAHAPLSIPQAEEIGPKTSEADSLLFIAPSLESVAPSTRQTDPRESLTRVAPPPPSALRPNAASTRGSLERPSDIERERDTPAPKPTQRHPARSNGPSELSPRSLEQLIEDEELAHRR